MHHNARSSLHGCVHFGQPILPSATCKRCKTDVSETTGSLRTAVCIKPFAAHPLYLPHNPQAFSASLGPFHHWRGCLDVPIQLPRPQLVQRVLPFPSGKLCQLAKRRLSIAVVNELLKDGRVRQSLPREVFVVGRLVASEVFEVRGQVVNCCVLASDDGCLWVREEVIAKIRCTVIDGDNASAESVPIYEREINSNSIWAT